MWKDYHDFWLKSKIPIHIIRYEDIKERPEPTMTELLKFILNVNSLEGTKVEKHIKMACGNPAPVVYKVRPGGGQVNANMDKFNRKLLDEMSDCVNELLLKFDYVDMFWTKQRLEKSIEKDQFKDYIKQHNQKALETSIYNLYESEDLVSIMVNHNMAKTLLRNSSTEWPEGRIPKTILASIKRNLICVGEVP